MTLPAGGKAGLGVITGELAERLWNEGMRPTEQQIRRQDEELDVTQIALKLPALDQAAAYKLGNVLAIAFSGGDGGSLVRFDWIQNEGAEAVILLPDAGQFLMRLEPRRLAATQKWIKDAVSEQGRPGR